MSLEHDVEAMVNSQGLELYESAIVSRNGDTIFEVLLTGKDGVSLDQCAEVSRLLSPLLDVTPPVREEYRLEVGTAGIERKLTKLRHFQKSIGELVKVTLINTENFRGKLLTCEGETITLEDNDQGEQSFNFDEVLKARTYFEW